MLFLGGLLGLLLGLVGLGKENKKGKRKKRVGDLACDNLLIFDFVSAYRKRWFDIYMLPL